MLAERLRQVPQAKIAEVRNPAAGVTQTIVRVTVRRAWRFRRPVM